MLEQSESSEEQKEPKSIWGEPKLTREKALNEVEKWLDIKRIRPSVREEQKEAIEGMVECFELGIFSMNDETNEITHKLQFESSISELTYKTRINSAQFSKYSRKLKAGDTQGFINAKIACLTGQNTTIIANLDHEDSKIANQIAIFFI